MLSKLASLSISSLRKLDDEANNFYDRKRDLYEAALFTRYYTQHALRPYIDSKINHIRHFIKIPFIVEGIEFIDLPSILQDNNFVAHSDFSVCIVMLALRSPSSTVAHFAFCFTCCD